MPSSVRLNREKRTIQVMIELYCHGQGHAREAKANLCAECSSLLNYALNRVDKCRFQDVKPACARCQVHCYRAAERQLIRQVMRYAGPRMILSHPLLALHHLIDTYRFAPKSRNNLKKETTTHDESQD